MNFKHDKIMSISTGGTDIMGGYPSAYAGGAGFGGLGALGLFGLVGINSFLGRDGLNGNGGAIPGTTVLEQNVSELRKDVAEVGTGVAGVNTTVERLGNEVQGALAMQNLAQAGEFRNLDNRLCESEKSALQMGYSLSIQGFQNTQSIKDQAAANQIINQENFCSTKSLIQAEADETRALITSINTQNLRDRVLALENQLADNASRSRFREIEINVAQTNQQTQNQLQAQLQAQTQGIANALNMLGDQINRQTNSLINIGSGTVAGSGQSANLANTKVNS